MLCEYCVKKERKNSKNKLYSTRKRTKRDFYSFKTKEKKGILIVGIAFKRKWFADENKDCNGENNFSID